MSPADYGPSSDLTPAEILNLLWKRYMAKVTPVVLVLLIAGVGVWSSIYTVSTEGKAVVKRFGEVVRVAEPGLNFKLPFMIETATFVETERVLKEEFGFRTLPAESESRGLFSSASYSGSSRYAKSEADREQSLMLTGDLNVIDVEWVVQYRVSDPSLYLHSVREPEETLRDIAEAVTRRIVGNRLASDVLTQGRREIAVLLKDELSASLESYNIGLSITEVQLQDILPPETVKPAFDDVNAAQQEREQLINEAERQQNQVLARAEGEALQTVAEAEGYAAERVNTAQGEADRYLALLEAYQLAPEVTRQRMYLEAIDDVLPKVGRVLIVEPGQMGPLPLLNLDMDEKKGDAR